MARRILITGGSGGIGAAAVRLFAEEGGRVLFTYRSGEDRARRVARETGAAAIRWDAEDERGADGLIRRAEETLGGIDVLVNNAGVSLVRLAMDTTDEEFRRVTDVNLFGPFALTRAALPGMIRQRSGAIVNVASVWGRAGGAMESVYAASKAGLTAFTRAVALEVASCGIRVNAVAPGFIDTDMNRHLTPEETADLTEKIPLGRAGRPGEVAAVIRFLASPDASYITGETVNVDGGWKK